MQKQSASAADCPPNGPGLREQSSSLANAYYVWAEGTWICRAMQGHARGDEASFRANADRAASMMDRLNERSAYGDDNWKPIRDALRAGDFVVIKQFHEANNTDGACS